MVTLVDHQVSIGSNKFFLDLDPAVYGPSYTRWAYILQVFNLLDLIHGDSTIVLALVIGEQALIPHPVVNFPLIQKPKGCQWSLFVECLFCIGMGRG